jgi:hypothetical protein
MSPSSAEPQGHQRDCPPLSIGDRFGPVGRSSKTSNSPCSAVKLSVPPGNCQRLFLVTFQIEVLAVAIWAYFFA